MIPDSTDRRPIPLDVRVRYLTLTELYQAADTLGREMDACARTNDPDGEQAYGCRYETVIDEIERRALLRAEREGRRAAKMRAETDRWYAARGAEAER